MIEKIHIQNFKSLGNVTVDLPWVDGRPQAMVLIGPSGVGKSNFLRAIRFLRNYLLAGNEAVQAEGGWSCIWPNGQPQPFLISIQFRLPDFDESFAYDLAWDGKLQGGPPQNWYFVNFERLRIGGSIVLLRQGDKWVKWPGTDEGPHIDQTRLYLGQLPTVSEAVLAFSALTNGIGWHDFPATVFTTPAPAQRIGNNKKKFELKGLSDNADNYLSVLRDLTQDLREHRARRQILARLKQINPAIRSVELDSIQESKEIVVGHELGDHKIRLNLSQESDGFRRYYAHLLALYQTPPKQVLMFEEPENGIYPGALLNLAEEFNIAAEEQRGQILLTTHSPMLLDGFQPEQIRVVELDPRTQQTQIGLLDSSQSDSIKKRLLDTGELLTVDTPRIAVNDPAEAIS